MDTDTCQAAALVLPTLGAAAGCRLHYGPQDCIHAASGRTGLFPYLPPEGCQKWIPRVMLHCRRPDLAKRNLFDSCAWRPNFRTKRRRGVFREAESRTDPGDCEEVGIEPRHVAAAAAVVATEATEHWRYWLATPVQGQLSCVLPETTSE
jgi:hypothetical protein